MTLSVNTLRALTAMQLTSANTLPTSRTSKFGASSLMFRLIDGIGDYNLIESTGIDAFYSVSTENTVRD